jgi:PQQ-dependent catabolism-associated CXXCW motif protein
MRLPCSVTAVVLSALLAASAGAMTIEVQGTAIFASGPVVDDALRFEQALATPGVDTVVFVNSPGGDLWTGLRVGRLIAERGLRTVTAGQCVSACSIMFMGGRERRFADAFAPNLTYIGLHGAHRVDTRQVDPVLQPQLYAFYRQRMGAAFKTAVVNRALYEMDDAGAMLRVYDNGRDPKRVPVHCRSAQTPRKDCTEFAAEDAVSLGVVTDAALLHVEVPATLQLQPVVFNQRMVGAIGAIQPWLDALAVSACRTDSCRGKLRDWPQQRAHWALATRNAGGWWRVEGRDTPQQALVQALYRCNHVEASVALCDAEAVDGFDARAAQQRAATLHTAALEKLVPPSERFYASEEFGGGFTRAGLRSQRVNDITPGELPGITTVGTRELATLLKSATPPRLIDVSANPPEALPSALSLWNGGQAFDAQATDAEYDARFRALLALLAPEQSQPVVFYCVSRNCWLSANAAQRAAVAGWRQVRWYRGGLEAWRAAGLPTAPPIVRAVAN